MSNRAPDRQLGLSISELETMINRRMNELDGAQEDQEHLGPFADLLRTATLIAFHRAAELIDANNRRISEQLDGFGGQDHTVWEETEYPQRDSNPRSSP